MMGNRMDALFISLDIVGHIFFRYRRGSPSKFIAVTVASPNTNPPTRKTPDGKRRKALISNIRQTATLDLPPLGL